MAGQERDEFYNRVRELSRKADSVQIFRAGQYAIIGGLVGAVIGLGLHAVILEGIIGIAVGGIIGWKDAATRAYLLRAETDRLLDQCSAEERRALQERSKVSYLSAIVGQRRNS